LVIKALDPDWILIRIGIQPKMLDPDEINADPQPWFLVEVSGHKLSLLRLEFLSGFLIFIFPFYKMLFMIRLEFFLFRGFFLYGFLKPD
jgi:hypothetical protein